MGIFVYVAVFMALAAPLTALNAGDGSEPKPLFMPPSVTMNEDFYLIRSPLADVTLTCSAVGQPTPTVKWYKDDKELEQGAMAKVDKTGTLKLMMMGTAKGKYQCKADNPFGISQSNITELDMAFLNDFANPPAVVAPTTVNEGAPLKLDCMYTDPFSNPTPRWDWVMQDTIGGKNPTQESVVLNGRLSVDEKGGLYFQHVLSSDNRQNWYYVCEAWNPIQNIKKLGSPARLNIASQSPIPNSPPVLVHQNGQNGNIEVLEGDSLSMYCIFRGYPKIEIEWKKTSPGPNPRFQFFNGNTMVMIEDVKNTDQYEGTYECRGYQPGTANSVSAKFTVTVLQRPTFLEGPFNTNVTEGGSVTFTCRTQADPAATIEWLVNGKSLSSLAFDPRRVVTGNKYEFSQLRRGSGAADSDLQVVSCLAKNFRPDGVTEIGRSYKDGYINVVSVLKMTVPPVNQTIQDSSANVVLDCEFISDPSKAPDVLWYRENHPIVYKQERFEMAPNNSLIIFTKNFDNLDDVKGRYMCVGITRAPSQQVSAEASVSVKEGVVPVAPIASASIGLWWIGLILVLLIIILIIILLCCLIRRNRGESYPVDEVERKMGNDPEKDLKDQGFHDYQRKEKDPIGGSRASLDSSIKPLDSDDDSMLEYGDIDTGKFNEDGSFIGIYGTNEKKPNADSAV